VEPNFLEYLATRWDSLLEDAILHAQLVIFSLIAAAITGVVLGILTYRRRFAAEAVLAVASTILTIPSFALFALMISIPLVGLGFTPAFIALWLYGILSILRNTITGLQGVDPAVTESAKGMGMSNFQQLWRIELPLAWPVIIAGIRTSMLLLMGIAAIGAAVGAPGLGDAIFSGLSRVGGANALNLVLSGTLGIVLLAILLDFVMGFLGRLTTSRGVR
jgi:osmoprotectant transport system permease protein